MPKFQWILGFALALVLTAGCTKKDKLEYGLDRKDTLRINLNSEPPSLDWIKATDTTSAEVTDNIMEGLVEYNFADPELSLAPALATEWKSSKDVKTWTFVLRKDVKWNDGVPFTGQHVIDGWEYLLNPKTASEYAYSLYGVKNAKAYNEGKIKDFSEVGVKLDKDGNLVVELEQPISYFPYLLTHHATYPVRKDIIEKFKDRWTEPENIKTLGAYNLKVWDHDKAMVLERNDNYYGEKAKLKNILAYMINEQSTVLNLFDAGKLDSVHSLPSRELAHLKKRKEFREMGVLTIYYYGFNTKRPPVNNIKVRQAISSAIDRKQITDMIGGGQVPLTSWIPAGMFGYDPEQGIQFDVEKANKLLDEAGYKDRSKFPKIELAFNTNEDHQRIAENVQAQLKKNLGINVELKNEEWKVYLSTLNKENPNTAHMFRFGWQADYPDPNNFMALMTSYSDNNRSKWSNKTYDQLVEKAVSVADKEQRRKLYSEAQNILTGVDAAVAPVFVAVSTMLISDRAENYPVNRLARRKYKGVTLK